MTTYHYVLTVGDIRWHRYTGKGDVRSYRAPRGWQAFAELIDYHPITGKKLGGTKLPQSQWWIREEYWGNYGLD